jgi:Domain of unknown function (DUF4136)
VVRTRFRILVTSQVLALLSLPPGCGTPSKSNFSHIQLGETHPKVYMDPNTDFSKYRTFTVFRFAQTAKGTGINAIEESQLLFVARNVISGMGYKYVDSGDDADFVVALEYSNEYESQYIPPQQMTLPFYVGGGTSTTYSDYSGYVGGTYGSVSGTSTTQLPGYWTTQTYTTPGHTVGYYYPSISIEIVDTNFKKAVWRGVSVSSSTNPDVRLSGQFLVVELLANQLPPRQSEKKGDAGMYVMPLSTDGNKYFPTILHIIDDAPAKRAGLRKFDQIIEVDRKGTGNITIEEFLDLIDEPGQSIEFTVRRLDRILHKEIRIGHR